MDTGNRSRETPLTTEAIYALHALCMGGCQKKILGKSRWASDPEFTEADQAEFTEMVKGHGWTLAKGDETGSLWNCAGVCKPPFELSKCTRSRDGRINLICPEFLKKITIKSEES